jgi:hypothetical protein
MHNFRETWMSSSRSAGPGWNPAIPTRPYPSYKLAHQLAPDATPIRSAYVALLKQAQYFREVLDALKEVMIREPQNASLKADLIRADAEIDGVDAAISKAREFAASDPGNSIYDVFRQSYTRKLGAARRRFPYSRTRSRCGPPTRVSHLLSPGFMFILTCRPRRKLF